jgi:hypothetical protein
MTILAFDTHAFVKRLTSAGMPEAQAEILADVQTKLIDEKLATKADLAATERALKTDLAATERVLKADLAATERALKADIVILKGDIRETELRLEAKIETVKADLIKWTFGMIGFQTLAILGAVAALAKLVHG